MRAAFIGLMLGLLSANAAAAPSDSIRLLDVDILLSSMEPRCTPIDKPIEIEARVGAFQPSVPLGELLFELARQAASKQANVLYAIRLVATGSPDGAQAAALAARCNVPSKPTSADMIVPPVLTNAIRDSASATVFGLTPRSPTDFYQLGDKMALGDVPVERLQQLKDLVLSPDTYEDPALRKSCPFLASTAVQFHSKASGVWWVYSSLCQTAMIMTDETTMRSNPAFVVRPDKQQTISEILLRVTQDKKEGSSK